MKDHNTVARTDKPEGVRRDTGKFSIVYEWLLDAEISDRAKVLYGVLGRYADDSGYAFPGRKKIAERMRCSLSSLDRALDELVEIGALKVEQRFRDGAQVSNGYVLVSVTPPLLTYDEPPLFTGDEQNENHLERDERASLSRDPLVIGGKGARDALWDALTDVFGPAETKGARSLRGKMVTSLIGARATPDQIRVSPLLYRRVMPDGTIFTETALEKHWPLIMRDYQPTRRRAFCEECGYHDGEHAPDCNPERRTA